MAWIEILALGTLVARLADAFARLALPVCIAQSVDGTCRLERKNSYMEQVPLFRHVPGQPVATEQSSPIHPSAHWQRNPSSSKSLELVATATQVAPLRQGVLMQGSKCSQRSP